MVLVDNNVLSALAKIEQLELLPVVFSSVSTPSAVVDELHRAVVAGYEFVERIDAVTSYNGGWLVVASPSESELSQADDVRDHALSVTDAHCFAMAHQRDERLLTDDAHVGTIARQHDVEVWDLVAFLQGAIRFCGVESVKELEEILDALRRADNCRFTEDDFRALFEEFETSGESG